jgi:hypothetical protein
VPDGFPLALSTTLGQVDPPSPPTHGGWVTATFTSSQCGQAIVTARAGPVAQDAIAISLPCRLYLPAILRAY